MKLIVGIDPGVTTGIAILDTKLNVLLVESKKHFSKDEIIKRILEFGDPIIISCDVKKPPTLVKKIASAFNAKLIAPKEDLKIKKKFRLIKEFGFNGKIANRHERDSLAAAIFALNEVRALFDRIDYLVDKDIAEEVKDIILRGKGGNIKQVARVLSEKWSEKNETAKKTKGNN